MSPPQAAVGGRLPKQAASVLTPTTTTAIAAETAAAAAATSSSSMPAAVVPASTEAEHPTAATVAIEQAPTPPTPALTPDDKEYDDQPTAQELDPGVTGTTVWDAGMVLSSYLTHTLHNAVGSCVELGAGTGCVSLALATTGLVRDLYVTDIPQLVPLINSNVRGNTAVIHKATKMHVQAFTWGQWDQLDLLPKPHDTDLIVGSDLIYSANEKQAQLLLNTLTRMCGVDTVVYLGLGLVHRPERVEAFVASAKEKFASVDVMRDIPEERQTDDVMVVRLAGRKP